MTEIINAQDRQGAGPVVGELDSLVIQGYYTVQFHDADGNLVWQDTIKNLVPTAGKNFILDTVYAGSAYTAAIFMGLVDGGSAPSYAAGDTMASHAGWTENVSYSNATRPAPAFSSASGGAKATSSAVVFNTNATGTVAGCFIATNSTKSGTTGTLISEGNFSGGNQAISSGGTLSVTHTMTLT